MWSIFVAEMIFRKQITEKALESCFIDEAYIFTDDIEQFGVHPIATLNLRI